MNIKKYIVGGLGAAAMLSVGVMALAVETTTMPVRSHMPEQVVQIGPNGRTLLRGTVTAVETTSLTVKSWGGDWIINVLPSTKLMPGVDMSQFKVGDFVGVQGITSATAAWTVDASLVRDWTARVTIQEDRKEVKDLIRAAMPKNWQGIASNLNVATKTFTLTINGTAYNVVLTADAKIVNEKYAAIDFSAITSGDTVRVYGPATDTTITASVVRDTSIK